jgi:PKD repeat protein/LysM repeat protein
LLEPIFSGAGRLADALRRAGLKTKLILGASSALFAAAVIVMFSAAHSAMPSTPPAELLAETDSKGVPVGGSGLPNLNRDQELTHTVLDGETFSEIAYIYNIEIEKLALYNHIADINRVMEGTVIKIPSLTAEKKITPSTSFQTQRLTAASNPAKRGDPDVTLEIEVEQQFDGTAVTAHFSVNTPPNLDLRRWEWNLGNGRKSFRPTTFWTYEEPGTYTVSFTAYDEEGQAYSAEEVLIDVPHPATYQNTSQVFLTLESMGQSFTVTGKVKVGPTQDGKLDIPMVEVGTNGDSTTYRATRPGFFRFEAEKDGIIRSFYVFVSPIESKHSDRSDLNWYRTQFNTGTQSNCGPTVASMGISWATGQYVAVSTVRHDVGWTGNGSTSFEDIMNLMKKYRANSRLVRAYAVQDVIDIIDRGNIAIVLYNSGGPKLNKYPESDMFGRYYYDAVGHYVVIKGYSLDRGYFVVYDPIPSDWGSNSFRYADGISMIGRNRYYGAQDMFESFRRADVIEVLRTQPSDLGY